MREVIEWLNQRNSRERMLLFAAALAVPYGVWDSLLMQPLANRTAAALKQTEAIELEVHGLEGQAEKLAAELQIDLDAHNKARREDLQSVVENLEHQLDARTDDLIPPAEMTRVLKELLARQKGLRLLELESLPVEPLFKDPTAAIKAEGGALFKHGVMIRFEGDFRSTVRYLDEIEQLPWRFFWESLEYEVEEYPTAVATLRMRSLSTDKGLIGV